MTLSMHAVSAPVFVRMLNNTLAWIDLAEENAKSREFDPHAFFNARLAPDMLPFCSQIRIASDHAKGCTARLAQVEIPSFADDEETLDDLRARIDKTIDFVESVDAAAFEGSETREIALKIRKLEMTMDGLTYLNHFALPNFYFHVTTAYDILRHSGVALGKRAFLAAAQ